jgi:very-short-patch-repair endonuclease
VANNLRGWPQSPAALLLATEGSMSAPSRQQLKSQALLAERAHGMRLSPTETEQKLWRAITRIQPGVAFRRQVPVDRFILDFLAPALTLVIEVDGASHARRVAADARRDRMLARFGYRALRIDAELVRTNLPEVVAHIVAAIGSSR